jgi:2-iminobutanoate/2-iminopropanoate deaminase
MIERISVAGAPQPQGPYSPAVRAGDFVFVSGQGAIDPEKNEFRFGDIQQQTTLTLENIKRILEGCGARVSDVVKCSVFLADAADFEAMNQVYAQFFGNDKPARTTVQAVLLAAEMKIEIDCVAYAPIGR